MKKFNNSFIGKIMILVYLLTSLIVNFSPNIKAKASSNYNEKLNEKYHFEFTKDLEIPANNLKKIIYEKGIYIAIGEYGTIRVSKDGVNWDIVDVNVKEDLNDIAFNGKIFVIVGNKGILMTSEDGFNWTQIKIPLDFWYTDEKGEVVDVYLSSDINSITWGNGRFIILTGSYGEMWSSNNGVNWSKISGLDDKINKQNTFLKKIIYTGKEYLVVGYRENSNYIPESILLRSLDGNKWDTLIYGQFNHYFKDIDKNNDEYIINCGNKILISKDLKKWEYLNNNFSQIKNIKIFNGKIYIVAVENIKYNYPDSVFKYENNSWVDLKINVDESNDFIVKNNEDLIAVGRFGNLYIKIGNKVTYKKLGLTNENILDIAENSKFKLIITENSMLKLQKDFSGQKNYTQINLGPTWEIGYLRRIMWKEDKFFLLTSKGIYTSTDGDYWNKIDDTSGLYNFKIINNKIYAVGESGTVLVCNDNNYFKKVASISGETFIDLEGNNDVFVLITNSKKIYVTKDFSSWKQIILNDNGDSKAIIWDGKKFLLANNKLYYSYDGYTWKIIANHSVNDIIYTDGLYITVYYYGEIYISEDGFYWTKVNTNITENIFKIKKLSSNYLLGNSGTLYDFSIYIKRNSPKTQWTSVLSSNTINDLAYNEHYIVAVGRNGEIIRKSIKNNLWESIISPTTEDLNSIIWTGKKFVVVGNKGTILTSTDGKKWNINSNSISDDFVDIVYNGEYLLACSSQGTFIKSFDGEKWEVILSTFNIRPKSIIWDGKKFVLAGGNWYGEIYTSINGYDWKKQDVEGQVWFSNITYLNNIYVATNEWGEIAVSNDGYKWNINKLGNNFHINYITNDGKQFILIATDGAYMTSEGAKIFKSIDGINWNKENVLVPGHKIFSVLSNYYVTNNFYRLLFNSKNFTDWTREIDYIHFKNVTIGGKDNDRLVAVGGDFNTDIDNEYNIYISFDAVNWKKVKTTNNGLQSVIWDGKKFIAVGQYGVICYSEDGIEWNNINLSGVYLLNGIAYNGKAYVTVGNYGIFYSQDVLNWHKLDSYSNFSFTDVKTYKDKFIAIGRDESIGKSVILDSNDGIKWNIVKIFEDKNTFLYSIIVGEKNYIVTSQNKVIIVQDSKIEIKDIKNHLSMLGGIWTGEKYLGITNRILYSNDGSSWDGEEMLLNNLFYSAAILKNKTVIVGENSNILIKDCRINNPVFVKILGNDIINLNSIGDAIESYTVEVFDNNKKLLKGYNFKWCLLDKVKGVEIDSKTGILKVSPQLKDKYIRIKAESIENPNIYGIKLIHLKVLEKDSIANPFEGKDKNYLDQMEQEAINHFNIYRKELSLPLVTKNNLLTLAAQAHSNYLYSNKTISHYQKISNKLFIGVTPKDRAKYYGYINNVGEGISQCSKQMWMGIEQLMDAPYHRLSIINPNFTEVGIGLSGRTTVVNYGGKNQKDSRLVVYPYEGQKNVKQGWFVSEDPNPLRFYKKDKIFVGYPISVSIHDSETIELKTVSVSLTDENGKEVPFYLVDSSKEDNLKKHAFIIPKKELKKNTTYKVKFEGIRKTKDQDILVKKEWIFTTLPNLEVLYGELEEINNEKLVKLYLKNGDLLDIEYSVYQNGKEVMSYKNGQYKYNEGIKDGRYIIKLKHPNFSSVYYEMLVNGWKLHFNNYEPVIGVNLNITNKIAKVGESFKLIATVLPNNATNKGIAWISSNAKVVTVDKNGKVTAVGVGTAIITAKTVDGEKTATCKITVNPIKVSGVKLNKTTLTLKKGSKYRLISTINPTNATDKKVTWSSSNTKVVKVDTNGNIIALRKGTVTITVKTVDGGYKATCKIIVQ